MCYKNKDLHWATRHKEVKVFIDSFSLKHYEKIPQYIQYCGIFVISFQRKTT